MTTETVNNLKALLHRMRVKDPNFRVFGATTHKYQIGPTLTESELQAFEQTHRVVLPDDYRFFLKVAGNGGVTRSTAPVIAINAGAGPGYGLLPLEEAILGCDLSKPFPLTGSTEDQPVQVPEEWGDGEPYPGVLEISYSGCAFFSYLVVNGPTYGTVWEADVDLRNFYPTSLSFEAWYKRWTDSLVEKALPKLAKERTVEYVDVGMTKSQVINICSGAWHQRDSGDKHSFLSFEHLITQFELDENEIVVRIVRHSIV